MYATVRKDTPDMTLISKLNRTVGGFSIARERKNQIRRSKKFSVSHAARATAFENHLELVQNFEGRQSKALVIAYDNHVLSRIEIDRVSDEAHAVLSRADLESVFQKLSELDDTSFVEVESEPEREPEYYHLQLGWVFDTDNQGAQIDGFISDDAVVRRSAVEAVLGVSETKALESYESVVWAGRALTTSVDSDHPVHFSQGVARIRGNRHNRLILVIGDPEPVRLAVFADSVDAIANRLEIRGRITVLTGTLATAETVWLSTNTGNEIEGACELTLDEKWTAHDNGRPTYAFHSTTVFEASRWEELETSDYFDAYLRVKSYDTDETADKRVSRVPFLARLLHTQSVARASVGELSLVPYFTFKVKALSSRVEFYKKHGQPLLKPSRGQVASLRHERSGKAPIWLVGELPYKAQDNGMHFYRWMRENHPEIDTYYVIDRDSPERENLGFFDHVVDYGSGEHFNLALQAERFIGTHNPDYLYPTRNPSFVKRLRGTRVFLQHGVMGAKWTVPLYGKKSTSFDTDLFCVSSEYEKSYIVSDYGYDPDEVAVTGLSRFDTLLGNDQRPEPGTVLVMPTWRDWLRRQEGFTETEYFREWVGLLTSPELERLRREQGLKFTLCLHPNMQRFSQYFDDVQADVVYQGQEDVQQLIMRHACMITDYSSVGFDFSFQDRPVIYFQFDRNRFIGRNGSHIDLDAELPGYIAFDSSRVIARLSDLAKHGFAQPQDFRVRAQKFLDHKDTQNSQRVFDAVRRAPANQRHYTQSAITESGSVAYRWFRRGPIYYPVAKSLYAIARRLPRKRGLTIFESHLGRQVSDSPKYIYEELVKVRPNEPKIWVVRGGRHRFSDPNTREVKRLSLTYFWNMGRAQSWVMNQSAPYYMRRPRKTNFIQTWHGTPLKKMQHDAKLSVGRDEGYLTRMEKATSQWSTLLSPSSFATQAFRSAFRITGKVAEIGSPRNDILVNEAGRRRAQQVREYLSIDEDQRVILYAPTFRDDQFTVTGKFAFDLPFDLENFVASVPENYLLLLRLHSQASRKIDIPIELAHRVRNVSDYDETQDLLLVSDLLVTDYSSIFFDAALLRRPMVFYPYDLEHYRDTLRGFYLDYESTVPGPIVRSQSELWSEIDNSMESGIDEKRRDDFTARFNPNDDGDVSRRVVEQFFD
jgi:CDP-glycerol glycerophosphotransferase